MTWATRTEGHAMFRNRISTIMMEPEPLRLPQPPAPPLNPRAFMLCPVAVASPQHSQLQVWLYQRAFELAQAAARPSILERDLLGVWN
jgi:hypothetical protein